MYELKLCCCCRRWAPLVQRSTKSDAINQRHIISSRLLLLLLFGLFPFSSSSILYSLFLAVVVVVGSSVERRRRRRRLMTPSVTKRETQWTATKRLNGLFARFRFYFVDKKRERGRRGGEGKWKGRVAASGTSILDWFFNSRRATAAAAAAVNCCFHSFLSFVVVTFPKLNFLFLRHFKEEKKGLGGRTQ